MKVKHLLVNELYRFGQFKRWRFSGIPLYMYVHTVEKGHEVGNSLLHLALFRDFYGSVYAVYNHNTRVSIDVIIGGKYFFEMVNVNTMGVDNVFCFLQLCIIRLLDYTHQRDMLLQLYFPLINQLIYQLFTINQLGSEN